MLICSLLICACNREKIEPVDIAAEDMCATCRMAISEKRYAAELLSHDGDVFKFDDIGCMKTYVSQNSIPRDPHLFVYYVTDYNSGKWVEGFEAYFVKSPEFKTPMSGQIAAFQNRAKAEEMALKYHSTVINFNQALAEDR